MNKSKNLIRLVSVILLCLLALPFFALVVTPVGVIDDSTTANADATATETITIPEPTVPLLKVPVKASGIQYEKVYTHAAVSERIAEVEQTMGDIQSAVDSGQYTFDACEQMVVELNRLEDVRMRYTKDQTKYAKWEDEYSVAAYVWAALKADGYSDEVCAGILGNMMAECGGYTLTLDYTAYNSREHGGGLCGWLYGYYPEANGASLEEQVNILLCTIEEQIDYTYSYEQFTQITDVRTAALTFAKHYERCATGSYTARQRSAQRAYDYFVLDASY